MSTFLEELQKDSRETVTENGGKCYHSSNSKLFDYFINIATFRGKEEETKEAFRKAFLENEKYALKAMFYGRDIRNGGAGERECFRNSFVQYSDENPVDSTRFLHLIPQFGRWDDLIEIYFRSSSQIARDSILKLIYTQIQQDLKEEFPSLLAKWMPSENASSLETKRKAKFLANQLGYKNDMKAYRKTLSTLRAKINVLETELCQSPDWNEIDLSKVPQKAFVKYRNAFWKKIPDKMETFCQKVVSGEIEMKVDILYPYDIITSDIISDWRCQSKFDENDIALADAQWKSLPDYVYGCHDMIIVGDSSGSMTSNNARPMRTMIGLAIYFAERNRGIWKDKFITFSESPTLVELAGKSIADKIKCIPEIIENTDIDKVFELLYNTAKKSNSNVPNLCFITDMQFDEGTEGDNKTIFEHWKEKFEKEDIRFPNVVFWNVGSNSMSFQSFGDIPNLQYANGYGLSVFKQVIEGIGLTQYEAMMKVLNRDCYNVIE